MTLGCNPDSGVILSNAKDPFLPSTRHSFWLVVATACMLTACAEPPSFLDEPRQYHWRQEAAQLRAINWPLTTLRITGLNPSPSMILPKATTACQHLPLEHRTTTQSGVNETLVTTQCWQAPYYNSGLRLQGRPR